MSALIVVRDTANVSFGKLQREDFKFDWHADQRDRRSVLGHAQFHKGRIKDDDPVVDTAQTPMRLDGRLALREKMRKTFTDNFPNN